MVNELAAHLVARNNEVRVRNLYETGFDPVLSSSDFAVIANGQIPADIAAEQEHISWAEHLIFVFPVWWGGMPAIMKGYVDRVFAEGFAYRYVENGSESLLSPRLASTVCSTGEDYEQDGEVHRAMNLIFKKIIFGFSGLKPFKQLIYNAVPCVSHETRVSYIENAKHEFAE
jgi:NAD(P)H dehydrogenase (quinone)